MGLLHAVEFSSDLSAAVVSACNEAGLLLNPVKPNTIRLMPPLTVSDGEIDQAVERLDAGARAGSAGRRVVLKSPVM